MFSTTIIMHQMHGSGLQIQITVMKYQKQKHGKRVLSAPNNFVNLRFQEMFNWLYLGSRSRKV